MSGSSVQEKLSKIFSESFQVKRLSKEISDLKDLREKGQFEIRMSVLRNECLVFRVDLLTAAFKDTKIAKQMRLMQEVKLMIRNDYPANPPKAYFMGSNMIRIGIRPFRDYIPLFLGDSAWSAKFTICQIIKSLPNFIEKIMNTPTFVHPFPTFEEYFELDNLFSWNFVQVHPIRLIKQPSSKQGFLVINLHLNEVMILDEVGLESSYKTCDYIQGSEIVSLRKKKNTTNRLLLEVKLSYKKMKGKYAIEFYSQDYDGLMIGIMDCARNSKVSFTDKPKTSESKEEESDSSSESENFDESESKEGTGGEQLPVNITEIQESILVYESLVDSSMTSENINQLVQLLKKAIEHYSASGDNRFRTYLDKLQSILSNQMAQVLLESANQGQTKIGKDKKKINENNQQQFASVIDLL